jgi:hypothetical protein
MKNDIRGLKRSNIWDYENGFYWFSPKVRINKMLAHYELYKSIINIPGHIFEFGVYKGASLIRFATFRDALENDYSRKIVGFDVFGAFPTSQLKVKDDLDFIERFEDEGGHGLSFEELKSVLSSKEFENFNLVEGNVFDTLPAYLKDNPETRIALLHLDMDVKEPTDFTLELLYERVVPGGLIIFDDYNSVAGETISVDNFANKFHLKLEKLPFYNTPTYVRKPI